MTVRLAGLDIGFSAKDKSSGVAIFHERLLLLNQCTANHAQEILLSKAPFDYLAIDGPCPPDDLDPACSRAVEHLFSRGIFWKRCKPGMSHVRRSGQPFRLAAMAARSALSGSAGQIVEAFPNAFLAVCLLNETHENRQPLPRGKKFDWLYDAWVGDGLTQRLLITLDVDHLDLTIKVAQTKNHDERAALICLLTAMCVAKGKFVSVGHAATGWFFLPPMGLWQDWARDGLEREARRLPTIEVIQT